MNEAGTAKTGRLVKAGVGLGAVGAAAYLARWLLQGEAIVYTDTSRAFWVSDPTLGWVETTDRWVWLGLDGLGGTVLVVLGTVVCALIARRAASRLGKVALALSRVGAFVSALAVVLPAWALLSGMPPADARRLLPDTSATAVVEPKGVTPLPVRSGRWAVLTHPSNNLVARISAGGETFDAKFAPLTADVTIDAADLAKSTATFTAPTASVDTGVALRNDHAKGYLGADKFPVLTVAVKRISAVTSLAADARGLAAEVEVDLLGKKQTVPLEARVALVSAAERQRLGVDAVEVLLVSGSLKLNVAASGLDRKNFDADDIVINTRFLMRPVP